MVGVENGIEGWDDVEWFELARWEFVRANLVLGLGIGGCGGLWDGLVLIGVPEHFKVEGPGPHTMGGAD